MLVIEYLIPKNIIVKFLNKNNDYSKDLFGMVVIFISV